MLVALIFLFLSRGVVAASEWGPTLGGYVVDDSTHLPFGILPHIWVDNGTAPLCGTTTSLAIKIRAGLPGVDGMTSVAGDGSLDSLGVPIYKMVGDTNAAIAAATDYTGLCVQGTDAAGSTVQFESIKADVSGYAVGGTPTMANKRASPIIGTSFKGASAEFGGNAAKFGPSTEVYKSILSSTYIINGLFKESGKQELLHNGNRNKWLNAAAKEDDTAAANGAASGTAAFTTLKWVHKVPNAANTFSIDVTAFGGNHDTADKFFLSTDNATNGNLSKAASSLKFVSWYTCQKDGTNSTCAAGSMVNMLSFSGADTTTAAELGEFILEGYTLWTGNGVNGTKKNLFGTATFARNAAWGAASNDVQVNRSKLYKDQKAALKDIALFYLDTDKSPFGQVNVFYQPLFAPDTELTYADVKTHLEIYSPINETEWTALTKEDDTEVVDQLKAFKGIEKYPFGFVDQPTSAGSQPIVYLNDYIFMMKALSDLSAFLLNTRRHKYFDTITLENDYIKLGQGCYEEDTVKMEKGFYKQLGYYAAATATTRFGLKTFFVKADSFDNTKYEAPKYGSWANLKETSYDAPPEYATFKTSVGSTSEIAVVNKKYNSQNSVWGKLTKQLGPEDNKDHLANVTVYEIPKYALGAEEGKFDGQAFDVVKKLFPGIPYYKEPAPTDLATVLVVKLFEKEAAQFGASGKFEDTAKSIKGNITGSFASKDMLGSWQAAADEVKTIPAACDGSKKGQVTDFVGKDFLWDATVNVWFDAWNISGATQTNAKYKERVMEFAKTKKK